MTHSQSQHMRFLKRFSLTVGVILLLVFGLNFVIDPFNKNGQFNLDVPKSDVALKMHYPLYKSLEYRQQPATTVILGDSRANALKSSYFADLGRSDVYNMAYGGGTAAEIIDSFWYIQNIGVVKNVWIGLPFNLFNPSSSSSRFREVESLREKALPYYLSTLVTKASVLTAGSALAGKALKSEAPDMNKEQFWSSQLGVTTSKHYGNWQEPTELKQALIDVARYCRDNNIKLMFFIPPTHVDLQNKIDEFGLRDEYQAYLDFLGQMAPVYDFDFPNTTTRNKELFKDPYHANQEVNQNIAKWLLRGEDETLSVDFVRYLPRK
ncbi:MAG: hypothetical protein AB8G18_08975 [Gammaproteobacteria bacterium]